jgi:hypothetical protein
MRGLYDVPALQREAADEIERLRGIAEGRAKNAADEIERLRHIHTDLWTLNGKQGAEIERLRNVLLGIAERASIGSVAPEFAPQEHTVNWGDKP